MQSVKVMMLTAVFSLSVGTAVAAPSTALPKAPDSAAKKDAVTGAETAVQKEKPSAPKEITAAQPNMAMVQDKLDQKIEPDATSSTNEAAKDQAKVKDETQLVQDRLAEIVEDDYAYEKARRKLANLVELQKMISQIRKMSAEDKKYSTPIQKVEVTQPAKAEPVKTAAPSVMPRVLFETQIGGSQRTAVSDGDELRYVRNGEVFTIGGSDYKLAKDRKSVVLARDAAK